MVRVCRRNSAARAPLQATAIASKNAGENVPFISAIRPAIQGPNACPMPKKSVMNPRAAGAILDPS